MPETKTSSPLVSIVVPVYNEEATLENIIKRLQDVPHRTEIIISDDGSEDRSREIANALEREYPNVKVVLAERNRGKGSAVRQGIAISTGDILLIQDADLEYDPVDIPALIEPIISGAADVVFGTRFKGGQPQRVHLFWHSVGNRSLTFMTNVLFNSTLSDMEVGYKAFVGDLIRSFHLQSDDFRIEPEMTAAVLSDPSIRIYEIPIRYFGRSYDEGKKITWRDGFGAVQAIVKYRISPPSRNS
jgi:glycosyltransferase involved in cell wall biosynthesis